MQYWQPFSNNYRLHDDPMNRIYNPNFYQQQQMPDAFHLNFPQIKFQHPPISNFYFPPTFRTIITPYYSNSYKPIETSSMGHLVHVEEMNPVLKPTLSNQVQFPVPRRIFDDDIEKINKDLKEINPTAASNDVQVTIATVKNENNPDEDQVAERTFNDELGNDSTPTADTDLGKTNDSEDGITARILGEIPSNENVPSDNSETSIEKITSSTESPIDSDKGQTSLSPDVGRSENEPVNRQDLSDIQVPEILDKKIDTLIDTVVDGDVQNITQPTQFVEKKKKCKNKEWLKKQIGEWLSENYETLVAKAKQEQANQ